MWKYIVKKLLLAIPVLLGITIIDYVIMSLAGSPLDMMTGPRVTEGTVAARAAAWGLDQPIYVQYWNWLKELFHGNLGYAYKSGQAVSEIIGSHIGPTLLLMGVSMVLGLLLAVPAGIYSAVHRYQKRDYAVVSASFLASSIPGFFLAMQPNKERVGGSFLRSVLTLAAPGGIAVAVTAAAASALQFAGIAPEDCSSMALILAGIIGLIELYIVSKPLDLLRACVLTGMALAFAAAVNWLGKVFFLTVRTMPLSCWAWLGALMGIGLAIMWLLYGRAKKMAAPEELRNRG